MIDLILKYFPSLSEVQVRQLEQLIPLYTEWNEKINVVSRKDIDNLELKHILHSLSIAKFIKFSDGTRVLDLGTGGGFPGIPLAILFPNVHFHLIDRIGKKLKVAADIADKIGLKNVSLQHGDIGECHEKFDFVVSRAVMDQGEIMRLVKKNIANGEHNALPNGVITLKGGDLTAELSKLRTSTEEIAISSWFDDPFFATKKVVYTSAK